MLPSWFGKLYYERVSTLSYEAGRRPRGHTPDSFEGRASFFSRCWGKLRIGKETQKVCNPVRASAIPGEKRRPDGRVWNERNYRIIIVDGAGADDRYCIVSGQAANFCMSAMICAPIIVSRCSDQWPA